MPVAKLAICSTSTGNKNWIHIGRCVDLVRRVVHLKGSAHSFSSENKAHICLVDLLYLCIKTFSSFGFLKTRLLVCTCSLMSKRAVLFTIFFSFVKQVVVCTCVSGLCLLHVAQRLHPRFGSFETSKPLGKKQIFTVIID